MCHLCSLPAHDAFITLVCHLFNSREGHFLPAFSLWDVFLKFPLLLFILSCSELHGLSEELHPERGLAGLQAEQGVCPVLHPCSRFFPFCSRTRAHVSCCVLTSAELLKNFLLKVVCCESVEKVCGYAYIVLFFPPFFPSFPPLLNTAPRETPLAKCNVALVHEPGTGWVLRSSRGGGEAGPN